MNFLRKFRLAILPQVVIAKILKKNSHFMLVLIFYFFASLFTIKVKKIILKNYKLKIKNINFFRRK